MDNMRLTNFAVHYIDPKASGPEYSSSQTRVDELPAEVSEFLLRKLVNRQLFDATDQGLTQSSVFDGTEESEEVSNRVKDVLSGDSIRFYEASRWFANRLHSVSPPIATTGILAILRLLIGDDDKELALLLKIRDERKSFVRLADGLRTELHVLKVNDILQTSVLKAACLPHPSRSIYDAVVVDKQRAGKEVADYFAQSFLALRVNEQDEKAIEMLLEAIQTFALETNSQVQIGHAPAFVLALLAHTGDITNEVIAAAAYGTGLLVEGDNTPPLEGYLKRRFGMINILPRNFKGRGKSQEIPRELSYTVTGYRGGKLTIFGSAALLQQFISVNGDEIRFRISTSSNGCHVRYK